MKNILRFLLSLSCLSTILTLKTAEPSKEVELKVPRFLVLAYDQTFREQAFTCIQELITKGLLESLNIQPSLESAAVAQTKEFFAEAARRMDNIVPIAVKSSMTLSGFHYYVEKQEQRTLKNIFIDKRPIIILCDTYGTKILQELLKKCPDNAVHSVILINPSVYQPLNFNAISNRVYNFYSKIGSGVMLTATVRKYMPENNGFIVKSDHVWSKIVNIRCLFEDKQNQEQEVNFAPQYLQALNIPKLIQLANEHFRCSWDLSAMVASMAGGTSNYKDISLPLLFINRELVIVEEGVKNVQVKNVQEGWAQRLESREQIATIEKSLTQEREYNAQSIAPCYDNEKKDWKCPALKDTPFIKGEKAKEARQITSMVFFVPLNQNNGVELVAVIKSNQQNAVNGRLFKVIIAGRECPFNFIPLGQNTSPVTTQFANILASSASLMNWINDNDYYGILRCAIPFDQLQIFANKNAQLLFENKPLDYAIVPNIDREQAINFIALGDVQKQNQSYPVEDLRSGSAISLIAPIIQANEQTPPSLYLILGDLVRNGKCWSSWVQILLSLNQLLGRDKYPNSLVTSALGTHDFTDIDWMLLSFYAMYPIYSYLFNNYDYQPAMTVPVKLEPLEVIKGSNLWFDRGRVRFIHLPYATEEEDAALADEGDYIVKNVFKTIRHAGYPLKFQPKIIIKDFLIAVSTAYTAKKEGLIDFIVVYGHAPLATAPQYQHLHPGILNSLINDKFESSENRQDANNIIDYMQLYGVDLYLSGHNHQYDHCLIEYRQRNKTKGTEAYLRLHAVTVGLGTKLRTAENLNSVAPVLTGSIQSGEAIETSLSISSQCFISGKGIYMCEKFDPTNYADNGHFLPAYLKCTVQGKHMKCQLVTKDKKVLDEFEIDSRAP